MINGWLFQCRTYIQNEFGRILTVNDVICYRYPDRDQLQSIYSAYLTPVLHRVLSGHPVWGSGAKVHALAGSMVQVRADGFLIT